MTTNSPDRRVQRTRARLHEALASLMHEKSYEEVVVKEILGRADVGRSTFYNHFRSKGELLDSNIRDVLAGGRTLAPTRCSIADEVLESLLRVFQHIEQQLAAGKRLDDRGQAIVHRRLQQLLVRRTAEILERWPADQRGGGLHLPEEMIPHFVASTFMVVLQWRLESKAATASEDASQILRRLLAPALSNKSS